MRIFLLVATLGFSLNLFASEPSHLDANKAASTKAATEHNFEDLLVQGKYHFSDESVTTVEEDKVLDSLIGVRSDFKDRLKKSSELY